MAREEILTWHPPAVFQRQYFIERLNHDGIMHGSDYLPATIYKLLEPLHK
jgi:hypothetical protein